jgi:DNA-binding transcriptional regulator YhcF (GntR family)/DNA-binding LacI/PurR family transcriptional regulator
VAEKLLDSIRADRGQCLPSIIDLAEQYGVSYLTMWKAVRILADQGLVRTVRGRGIATTGPDGAPGNPAWQSSTDRIHDTIRGRIADGKYQSGKPLPKTEALAASEGVSRVTLSRALKRLEKDHLVHRVRARWHTGANPPSAIVSQSVHLSSDGPPVVLVLISDQASWMEALRPSFIFRFMGPFSDELFSHGVHLQLKPRRTYMPHNATYARVPFEEVASTVRGLGARYRGALIQCTTPDSEQLDEWITSLARFNRPVVYFDYADRGSHLTRTSLSSKNYFRLFQDEAAACELAVDELLRRGHRTVAVQRTARFEWGARRIERIEQAASRAGRPLRVVVSGDAEPEWGYAGGHNDMHHFTTTVYRQIGFGSDYDDREPVADTRFRNHLLSRAASLAEVLTSSGSTALLSLNDHMSREQYFWLKALGAALPRHLSLVSFDNTPESALFPFASIDWGFGRLACLAAHIMIGDLPVRADRNGFLPGTCTLIDRGSVGTPGRVSDLARLLRLDAVEVKGRVPARMGVA